VPAPRGASPILRYQCRDEGADRPMPEKKQGKVQAARQEDVCAPRPKPDRASSPFRKCGRQTLGLLPKHRAHANGAAFKSIEHIVHCTRTEPYRVRRGRWWQRQSRYARHARCNREPCSQPGTVRDTKPSTKRAHGSRRSAARADCGTASAIPDLGPSFDANTNSEPQPDTDTDTHTHTFDRPDQGRLLWRLDHPGVLRYQT
jgi:hypothetical protein